MAFWRIITMNPKQAHKKPFLEIFREQKEELCGLLEFYEKLEENASEEVKAKMAQRSPLLENVGGLVHGNLELPSKTLKTAIDTLTEYIEALEKFSADQFSAFLLGLGINWLSLPYWGVPYLRFQIEKVEEAMEAFKEHEIALKEVGLPKIKIRNPYKVLPTYNPSKELLKSEILAITLSFLKSMLDTFADGPFLRDVN